MRLCYVLLSPTWGMHQYTADLANRMVADGWEVHLVTTTHAPRDRYAPEVAIHTPVASRDSGFSVGAISRGPLAVHRLSSIIRRLKPDLVHFSGPHLWNPILMGVLQSAGVPVVHTLHDLHPHTGAIYGRLLYPWNAWVWRRTDHLLVHGNRYREELLARGVEAARMTCTPLTFLFLSHAGEQTLLASSPPIQYEPSALFFGRLEIYKGLTVLVEAARLVDRNRYSIVVAGSGSPDRLGRDELPSNVQLHDRLVDNGEAIDLFSRCGLLVMPYVEASQSGLVASAYYFFKPVIVTQVGALPEYVIDGETGWVIPPGDPLALAGILHEALGDPDRLAWMGRAGRAWYERERQAEGETLRAMYAGLVHP